MKTIYFKKSLLHWSLVVLWCGLIFFLSSIPEHEIRVVPFYEFILRKIAHFVVYAILCFLFFNAFRLYNWKTSRVLFWSVFLSIVYAITDEYHQGFVPGRCPSVYDVIIDAFGAIVSGFFCAERLK